MNINPTVVKAAALFVNRHFNTNPGGSFRYHNRHHTNYVVKATARLCEAMEMGEHEKAILLTAALFHDLGFTVRIEGHEEAGASLAEDFLKASGVDEEEISLVKSCILATAYPQKPATVPEEILCDADLLYLGDVCFFRTSEALREEWKLTKGITYTDEEWCKQNIRFLSAHRFHTNYGRTVAERGKQRNIRRLEARLHLMQRSRWDVLNVSFSGPNATEPISRTEATLLNTKVLHTLGFHSTRV